MELSSAKVRSFWPVIIGTVLITTSIDASETHPDSFVTVKVNVPDESPDIVVLIPVPEVVVPPGERVKVQFSDGGKPLISTLPVVSASIGCVIFPTLGEVGVGFAETLNIRMMPEPHALFAATEIFPLPAPAVAVIDVVAELPLHPEGKVHVYEAAPVTADML